MTPDIQALVRDGHLTPKEGARLLEIRRDLSQRRQRRAHPWLSAMTAVGVFLLGFFGFRREPWTGGL